MKGFFMALSMLLICMIFLSIIFVETPQIKITDPKIVVTKEKHLNISSQNISTNVTLNNFGVKE